MRQRIGRPGLLGTVARTAVITGTATAVSGGMQRRQAERAAGQQAQAAAHQAAAQQAAYTPPPAPAAPAPAAAPAQDRIAQLQQLGELKSQGVLTEAEFEAEKARILAG